MPYGADPIASGAPAAGGYGKDRPAAAPQQQREEPPSALGSFFRSLVHGAGQTALGAAQLALGRRGAQPAARAPGEAAAIQGAGQLAGQREQAFQASPDVKQHPIWSGAGKIAGEALPTLALGGAPARSALGMIGQGAARGAVGGAMTPATGPPQDYWSEKAKQMAIGGAAGAALPAAGSAIAPRLLNPQLQNVQGIQRAFRPLYNFVMGGEDRTVNGFDRTIARQVLDPIGRDVPRNISGHGLLKHVEDKIGESYDAVLPNIALPRAALAPPSPEFRRYVDTMSTDHQQRLGKLLKNYVFDRFPTSGQPMDGPTFKRVQSELSQRAYSWLGTNDNELGRATYMALNWLNEAVERANPAMAPHLSRTNEAFRMFARMREAASRPTAEGKFTATDLLRSIGKSSDNFWKGDEPLQRYAEVGRRALGEGRESPLQLLHLFTRHGAVAEAGRSMIAPAGRGMKALGEAGAPAVGRTAAEMKQKSYDANRRGDLREVRDLARKRASAEE